MRTAGIVIGRQRPDTASGVIFVTLEDETGATNVIVWRDLSDRQRRELLGSRLMAVYGRVEREGDVVHLIAGPSRRPDADAGVAAHPLARFPLNLLVSAGLPQVGSQVDRQGKPVASKATGEARAGRTRPSAASELADARAQQAAVDEILRVMADSPADVTRILTAIAKEAAQLCHAPFARVTVVQDGVLRPLQAMHSMVRRGPPRRMCL